MRNAPAVHYPVGRCLLHGWLVWVFSGLGFVACAVWGWIVVMSPWLIWGSFGLAAMLATNGLIRWHTTSTGELSWNGHSWTYANAMGDSSNRRLIGLGVHVVLDLQSTMLIRILGADGEISWLWAEQRQYPTRWLAIRRALFAPGRVRRTVTPPTPLNKRTAGAASAVELMWRKP